MIKKKKLRIMVGDQEVVGIGTWQIGHGATNIHQDREGKFWFFDETWTHELGPYDSYEEANMWYRIFCRYLTYGYEAFIF